MQIGRDLKVFTIMAGMLVAAAGTSAGQTSSVPTGTAQSPYPTSADGGSTNAKTGSAGDTMGEAMSRQMDKRFLEQTTQAFLLSKALGKLAEEKSNSDAVRQFGKMMAADNDRGLGIFKRVAEKDGVTVSDKLDSKHQERLDKLAKLSGTAFDVAYVKDQLKAHQRLVSYFESEADNSNDTAAHRMATNLLPAVIQHLDATKDLNKNISITARR